MSFQKYIQPLVLCGALAALTGCDSPNQVNTETKAESAEGQPVDFRYVAWLTKASMTGFELSNALKEDEGAANLICLQDGNTPSGFTHHIALVSTQNLERIQLAEKYGLDSSLPVGSSTSDAILAPTLSDYLAQKGKVDPTKPSDRQTITLSLSDNGRFAGYCDSPYGYTSSDNAVNDNGELTHFVTRCNVQGAIVCLSIHDKLSPTGSLN